MHTVEIDLHGKKITLETGKMAKQANGSVVVRHADSVVLVSACGAKKPKPNQSFFPLTVDYREYTYSAGRFPGGFVKREGRPSEKEILTSRMIDRPIRPLFREGYMSEVQIIAMVLSADAEGDPDTLAMTGAGAALAISDIPFDHQIAAVRVGLMNGQYVANPTYSERASSKINIIVSGTRQGIVMVEAGANEAAEEEVLGAIEFGHDCCRKLIAGIDELVKLAGKPKWEFTPRVLDAELTAKIDAAFRADLTDALDTRKYGKLESYAKVDELHAKAVAMVAADGGDEAAQADAGEIFDRLKEKIFRHEILRSRRRPDGRAFNEIRPIAIEAGILPRTHGSSLFTRGETQALVTATLGTKDDEQRIEMLNLAETSKRFMLHYNFPPFSVGETGRYGAPGRREIGHGALAERALSAVLPSEADFPYTIRLVSDILESNGSSSMASVCGGSLSMMDAGVPISAAVAGVAMGLVIEGEDFAVLTDIAGAEDHYGDMDFKVAGTRKGITALQMDIKVTNVTIGVMRQALQQALEGRLFLLDQMDAVIDTPRKELSKYAPRIYAMTIPVEKIRELIGPGGKVIRGITDSTGVKIDVEDDGSVKVFASDGISAQKAIQMITDICAVAEVGKTYLGKVVRIADFGAFVEIFPGTDGLLHISEISESRVKNVRDELNEGDQIMVKVLALDGNKIKLSRKAILKEQREKMKAEKGA